MKKIAIAILVVFSVALMAFAAAGPETINLAEKWGLEATSKPAVEFPHAFHQSKNKCTECHATDEGGAIQNIEGKAIAPAGTLSKGKKDKTVHDEFCIKCHKEKKVPKGTSCNTCHKK